MAKRQEWAPWLPKWNSLPKAHSGGKKAGSMQPVAKSLFLFNSVYRGLASWGQGGGELAWAYRPPAPALSSALLVP